MHPYCGFSQQSAKFRTARFHEFRSTLRKDSVAIMDRFGRSYRRLLEDWMYFTMF